MSKYLNFLGIMILLTLIACKSDDGEGTLALEFNAEVDSEVLEFNKFYVINGDSVKFELLKFYISDYSIQDKDGETTTVLEDVAIINLKEEDEDFINYTLDEGVYKNPSLNIGLTVEQNESEPTSYASDHPLSAQQGNYWMMADSYIYIKLEGQYMMNGVEESFVYHIGHNEYVRNVEVDKSFSIHDGNTTTLIATLNLNTIFEDIDFATESTTHEANDLAEKMLTNFMNSFSIN